MYPLNHFKLGTKLIGGYVILLFLMLIISGVIFISLKRIIETSERVTYTYEVIRLAESVSTALFDMETAQRGFMVAGSNEYLEPFVNGQKRFDSLISQGVELTSENPQQNERWQAAAKIKEEWLTKAANPEIAARLNVIKGEQVTRYFELVSSRTVGKDIFDNIREAIYVLEQQFTNVDDGLHLGTLITLDLVNMETGQRGFLLTGKEISLEPYASGERSLKINLNRLRALVVEQNVNPVYIQTLEHLIDAWVEQAANIEIQARRDMNKYILNIDDIAQMMREDGGRALIEKLRGTLFEIIEVEEGLIKIRAQEKQGISDLAINFSLFGTLIAIVIGTMIAFAVARRILLADQKSSVLNSAVDSSAAAVLISSVSGHVEYINSSFTRITGYSKADLLGKEFDLLSSEKNNEESYQKIQKALNDDGQWQGQISTQRKDGSSFWSKLALSSVKNKKDQVTHLVSINEDISKEVELAKKLSYQASHDALTGLFNRFEFERRIELLLMGTWRANTEYAICFLDIDEFKIINDNGGHAAGDELLRQLGKVFTAIVREGDVVARIGGDEFAILIANASIVSAQEVAQKILDGIREFEFYWDDKKYRIGVSIGLVAINSNKVAISELLRQADTACYLAKENGKNRIQIYQQNDPDAKRVQGEMRWIERINNALDSNRFLLYAQPIVPLKGAGGTSYELLIRLRSRTGEIIAPGEFLPAAERYQMIMSIDKWVVKNAFDLLNEIPGFFDAGHTISINLSGQSIADDGVLYFVIKQLQSAKFKPSCICFEITETAAISTLKRANDFISELRRFGCKFSLDDFGSGFSSFGSLVSG